MTVTDKLSKRSDIKLALEEIIAQNEEVVRVGNKKTIEIINTQSKRSVGPCLTTIYDSELNKYFFGKNYKKGNTFIQSYNQWIINEAEDG